MTEAVGSSNMLAITYHAIMHYVSEDSNHHGCHENLILVLVTHVDFSEANLHTSLGVSLYTEGEHVCKCFMSTALIWNKFCITE
jgi:hypothetical protein